jgi:DNA repair exonuclease SbcCD ATPase subunit
MYLKRINNVIGYKNLPDGLSMDFDEKNNYIIGANFQGKSTIGSLFNWCLTGTNLYGKEKEQVANDKKRVSNVIVDITFVDNYGIEHRLIRNKSKEFNITLDDKEIKQDILSKYYKDKDVFLVAHNPYYFYSLEPKEQKDVLRKIVPTISAEDSYKLLDEYDKEIVKSPIDNLSSYTNDRNAEINELTKEYDKNEGFLQAFKEMALKSAGTLLKFDKQDELENLQSKYDIISKNFESSNLEDLQKSINRIATQLNEIMKVKLNEILEHYKQENSKLKLLKEQKPVCPSCRQEIKDVDSKNHLIYFSQKELQRLQQKADELKSEATKLINEKDEKTKIYERLKTQDIEKINNEKQLLETRINELLNEQKQIELNNREVQARQEQIDEAKRRIDFTEEVQKEILQNLKQSQEQKKIANKLKILIIEKQKEMISKYLNKVDIQFSKVNKTGEITECCNIQYEGRDYKKLSKSQQIRASLEISNVFNNLSGIKAPVFFDDAESTTDIEKIENTQMIVSMVVKYNPLEIVYNYDEVLEKRRASLDREIEENIDYLEIAA